jgi:teichoic acid transport system permease protein
VTPAVDDDAAAGLKPLGQRPPLPAYLASVWARRDFVVALPLGELQTRNANTLLGGLWHLMNPLILALTYFLVFGVFFDARDDVDNYIAFLLTGLFVFYYSQKCLTGGATTIVSNEGIIRNVNLPRATFPAGSVIAETVAHLPALGLLAIALLVTGEPVTAAWLLVLPAVALQALFNLGLSLWVGRLAFHFRDMQNLLPFVSRLLLYLSGVFFTAERVPEGVLRVLFGINPLHVFIELHRQLLITGGPVLRTWIAAAAWATLTLASGLVFFWASEASYGRD